MARTFSRDLRDRVIAAVDGGLSRNAAAERFGVAVATAVRWVQAWRTDGRPGPRPKEGDLRSQWVERYRDVILAAVAARVDITLVEFSRLLRETHGVSLAPSTIWRLLDRHGMTFKKRRPLASRRGQTWPCAGRPDPTPTLTSIRHIWFHRFSSSEGDQGSLHQDGPPARSRCARAPLLSTRAARALEDHTFTGALPLSGMTAPMVLEGPMNADAFRIHVARSSCPPRGRATSS